MGLFGKCIKACLKRLSSYKYTVWGLGLRHISSTLTSISCDFYNKDMRKRQVVLRREEASRSSTTSSFTVRNVRYGECQKNHAAGVGGFAVDGCREFMASGDEGSSGELTCAACGCHRNFHRREVETEIVCDCSSPSSNGS